MGKSTLSKRRGDYGRRKFRAFIVLQQLGYKYGRNGFLSTRELAILSGISYRSLTRCLPVWTKWDYVEARDATITGRNNKEYRLLEHGKAWLKVALERLYNRKKFFKELKGWVNLVLPNYNSLKVMNFNKMVEYLHAIQSYKGDYTDLRLTFDCREPFM